MVSSTPRPHFAPGKDPVPILQEAGWAPGPVWTGGKSRPHRDSIPDRPSSSSVVIPTELPGPPKWCGTELKKVEHALSKITATFCDRHAGRRIGPNIAGPTLGIILRSCDHYPTRGTHHGVTLVTVLWQR